MIKFKWRVSEIFRIFSLDADAWWKTIKKINWNKTEIVFISKNWTILNEIDNNFKKSNSALDPNDDIFKNFDRNEIETKIQRNRNIYMVSQRMSTKKLYKLIFEHRKPAKTKT